MKTTSIITSHLIDLMTFFFVVDNVKTDFVINIKPSKVSNYLTIL